MKRIYCVTYSTNDFGCFDSIWIKHEWLLNITVGVLHGQSMKKIEVKELVFPNEFDLDSWINDNELWLLDSQDDFQLN